MTPLLTTLDRYIARAIVVSTSLVFGIILALMIFVFVIDAIPDYGRGHFYAYELVRFVLLSQPRRVSEVLPVIALIGTTLGLSTLAFTSELTAMRAAGVSAGRIVLAALKVGVVFAGIGVVLSELVVPVTEDEAFTRRAHALQESLRKSQSGIWLRDGPAFINISEVLPDKTLLGVTIYSFDADGRLQEQLSAARARFENEAWRLETVRRATFGAERAAIASEQTAWWRSQLAPNVVEVFARQPEQLSVVQLARYIEHLRQNGLDTTRFRLSLWQKLLTPVATLVMVLLATPFVFRPVRSGGVSQRLFLGIMIGVVFMVLVRVFGLLGVVYGLPPLLAAALPVMVFLAVALVLLQRAT
jgi:lipopolysaccharide export system permease protein